MQQIEKHDRMIPQHGPGHIRQCSCGTQALGSSSTGNRQKAVQETEMLVWNRHMLLLHQRSITWQLPMSLVAWDSPMGTINSTSSRQPGNVTTDSQNGFRYHKRYSNKSFFRICFTGKSYVDIFMDAAAQSGVSPYVLAANASLQSRETNGGTP